MSRTLRTIFSNCLSRFFPRRRSWRCQYIDTAIKVSARQEMILGWDQDRFSKTKGLFLGAGGANGEICEGVTRKGLGVVHIADFDIVTPSNLARQKFLKKHLYNNKAIALCRVLSKQGFLGTKLVAHPCAFQELDVLGIAPGFVVCSVDNQLPETRLEVCKLCHLMKIACIFFAISTDADYGYVFVQEPGKACWNCVLKTDLMNPSRTSAQERCPNVPSCVDLLKTLGGIALYAIDTLVMNRKRDWNYYVLSLSRSDFGSAQMVERRPSCTVCGSS